MDLSSIGTLYYDIVLKSAYRLVKRRENVLQYTYISLQTKKKVKGKLKVAFHG